MPACAALKAHPLTLAPAPLLQGGAVAPLEMDSALFGPWALAALGLLALGLSGLGPVGVFLLGPLKSLDGGTRDAVPSAAPAHVLTLLGAGLNEAPLALRPLPPYIALSSMVWGGLWSRRLGPHREVWSWDIVEVAGADILISGVGADHTWGSRGGPANSVWGGGHLRLFRLGLVSSHHHLAGTGAFPASFHPEPPRTLLAAPLVGPIALYPWAVRVSPRPSRGAGGASSRPASTLYPSELAAMAWAGALLAPTAGALAAWAHSAGWAYAWLAAAPLAIWGAPSLPHANLTPLAHTFGSQLPWAPLPPLTGGPRCR